MEEKCDWCQLVECECGWKAMEAAQEKEIQEDFEALCDFIDNGGVPFQAHHLFI